YAAHASGIASPLVTSDQASEASVSLLSASAERTASAAVAPSISIASPFSSSERFSAPTIAATVQVISPSVFQMTAGVSGVTPAVSGLNSVFEFTSTQMLAFADALASFAHAA